MPPGEVFGARDVGEVPTAEIPIRLSLLDRALDAISPRLGARRYLQRVQQAHMEKYVASFGYVGGRTDRKSMQEWLPSGGDANSDILGQQGTLIARSRDLVRNTAIGSGAAATSTTNVVGTGLRLSSDVDAESLGLSDEQKREKQSELERLWKCTKDSLEFEGDAKDADLQALVFRSIFESGDILVLRRQRQDPGDIVGVKVQLIEADRICNPDAAMDSRKIAGGVEVDEGGRTVAYHVANVHPGDSLLQEVTSWQRVPKTGSGGLALSRLIFEKRRPGQRRGVPSLAPVMEPIKQITRLTDHELMSSVVSSMFTMFVESENQALGQLPVAPVGETAPSKAGDVFMPAGGSVIDLRPGEKVTVADPNRPNGQFAPFFTALVEQIGMAIEIPFEVLMHRYQNSFSAARAAVLDAYRHFVTRRQFLSDHFLDTVYEWVVFDAVVSGKIDLPGFLTDDIARKAWLGTTWIGPGQIQINPKDDVEAAIARVDAGFSDRQYETAQLTGRDWSRDVQPQREQEKERLDKAEMAFEARPTQMADQPEESAEDEGGTGTPPAKEDSGKEEEAA